jgi:hypothetical protein
MRAQSGAVTRTFAKETYHMRKRDNYRGTRDLYAQSGAAARRATHWRASWLRDAVDLCLYLLPLPTLAALTLEGRRYRLHARSLATCMV